MPKIGIGGTGNIDSVQMDEQGSTPSTPAAGKSAIYLKADGLYVIDDAGAVTGPLVSAAGGGYTEGARVYNDANITISTGGSGTALTFNSERYDTDTIHSTVSNTSRLTCNTTGKYLIVGNVQWASSSTGVRGVWIYLNNTTIIGLVLHAPTSATVETYQVVTTIYSLSATDYVELIAYQTSGGDLVVATAGNYSPEFMMQRIG